VRFARFTSGPGDAAVGVVRDGLIYPIPGADDLLPLLQAGTDALTEQGSRALRKSAAVEEAAVALLSPLAVPPTFRDFYAFERHVKAGRSWRGLDMDPAWYQIPVFYFSNPYAVTGCGEVLMTPGSSAFDFELEVAAVVTSGGRDLTPVEADRAIGGYCVLNDWSGRDVQQREMTLSMGPVKGKDTATSLGPYFVTRDEIAGRREGTGYALRMTCSVNGRQYSDALWSEVFWSFGEMAAYASRGTDIRPGDVLGSGTCGSGCIMELSRGPGGAEYPWLKPGDVVVAAVEGLGELVNTIVPGAPVLPLRASAEGA
jgi:2-keto-4-pentenoate hydratase/2-oxohepta-3-ene-1,7-dioic acid hydratase in catechol pathway